MRCDIMCKAQSSEFTSSIVCASLWMSANSLSLSLSLFLLLLRKNGRERERDRWGLLIHTIYNHTLLPITIYTPVSPVMWYIGKSNVYAVRFGLWWDRPLTQTLNTGHYSYIGLPINVSPYLRDCGLCIVHYTTFSDSYRYLSCDFFPLLSPPLRVYTPDFSVGGDYEGCSPSSILFHLFFAMIAHICNPYCDYDHLYTKPTIID